VVRHGRRGGGRVLCRDAQTDKQVAAAGDDNGNDAAATIAEQTNREVLGGIAADLSSLVRMSFLVRRVAHALAVAGGVSLHVSGCMFVHTARTGHPPAALGRRFCYCFRWACVIARLDAARGQPVHVCGNASYI
jgi:hypothetical protein